MKTTQRDKFRLWFAFLKIAQSDPPFLRGAIDWQRYEPWGPIQEYSSFEQWWTDYGKALQNPVVHEVECIPDTPPPNTIYLAVPLNRAPQRLAARARFIIQARLAQVYQERVQTKEGKRQTFKRGFYGSAWFTEGRDIRVGFYEDLLKLYAAVFKQHPGPVGVTTLAALNVVGARNAAKNAQHTKKGSARREPEFRLYTTYDQTPEELAKIDTRYKLEPYTKWAARTRKERAAAEASSHEQLLPDWKPPRLKTAVDKRLDYQNNPSAHAAIQNLRRAKDALRIVVNAVARGEFPGPKTQ